MQRSNTYIILFSLTLTIILGGLLSLASEGLKPAQKRAEELATKRQILSAVMEVGPNDDVLKIFDDRITSYVVDAAGERVEKEPDGTPIDVSKIDIEAEYKKQPDDRLYPVYQFHDEANSDEIKAYIFAFYGNGLWDNIWGYIALQTDMNTIVGAVFDHKGETPGLGARITTDLVQDRFTGKKIFDKQGNLVSVTMLKGENNPPNLLDDHHVNGMSGATLTGKGVNRMLKSYFEYYMPFMQKVMTKEQGMALMLNKKTK